MPFPRDTFLTRSQTRAADHFAINQLQIPGIVLMENAGRGCAEILIRELTSTDQSTQHPRRLPQILVCCGPGNNGGDGFVIARHLQIAGIPSQVILMAEPSTYSGDALINLKILEKMPIPRLLWGKDCDPHRFVELCHNAHQPCWIVDALLGTGFSGALREPYVELVEAINQAPCRRLAVDIPTGLCCDSGTVQNSCIKADITCTFIGNKMGFLNPSAQTYLGRVQVVSIGVPAEMIIPHT